MKNVKRKFIARPAAFLLSFSLAAVLMTGVVVAYSASTDDSTRAVAVSERMTLEKSERTTWINNEYGKPVRMAIQRVGLNLPINDGFYDPQTEEWSFVPKSAMTIDNNLPLRDQHGLVYIYGHNATDIFLPTYNLKDGDILELWTDTGAKLSYEFEKYYLITEHDHHVLDDEAANRIRLITCQGVGAPLRRLSQFKRLGPATFDGNIPVQSFL